MLSGLSSVQALALHKGCLFVAQGSLIRFSEPENPRYFRDWGCMDALGEVLAIVSKGEIAEVFTKTAVKYITGSAPYFEIRDTSITEGPASASSIVKTDVGTFALFDDGIYVVNGQNRKNITAGMNTPFVEGLVEPQNAIGGASKGVYYLVDADGSCLAYDWEEDEWFFRRFDSRPLAFAYLDDARGLVARLGGQTPTHLKIAASDEPVRWALSWPEKGDGKLRTMPSRLTVDCEGEMAFSYRVDGEILSAQPISGTAEIPLPVARGRSAQITLSGENSPSGAAIRSARWR
ncbi:hypothetical protein FDZ71_03275 [bacterium]|nr:MAG: hypothetical protein FDZ71_03275 [bacterium]